MPGVKITFDVSDGINNLQAITQTVQNFTNALKLSNDEADKLINRLKNKAYAQIALEKAQVSKDTDTKSKATGQESNIDKNTENNDQKMLKM